MDTHLTPLPSVDVELNDGSTAVIRPVLREDRALIEEGLAHMSLQSRIGRFGTAVEHFSDSELAYLTDIDLVDHVAWGALIEDHPAASGRYIKVPGEEEAEMAVAVVDQFQRRGLGRILFGALVASARHNGIRNLYFAVQPANSVVVRMLRGVEMVLDEGEGLLVGRFSVDDVTPGRHDDQFVEVLRWYQERN